MGKHSPRGSLLAAVLCLIFCFALVAVAYFVLENERDVVIIAGGCVVGFAVMLCLSVILGNTFVYELKCRRAAFKAMGRDSFKAVIKDKVAKTAHKGIYYMIKGDSARAEELLISALSLADVRQNQLFCVEWLVRLYEAADDSAKLLWCYRKAADYAPDNADIQSRLGHAYYVDGKLDKAMYCFEQALHYDPNHGYSRFSIAKIHMVRGEDDKAISVLEELLAIQENHPLVFSELATIYAMHREDDKCREYYEKAILCGYEDAEKLSKRMTAIYEFNKAQGADGSDLPSEYYRHIQTEEEKKPKCTSSCEHCDLNKKCEKGEEDAGDE